MGESPPPPPPRPDAPAPGARSFWRRWTRGWRLAVTVIVGLFAVMVILAGIFGEDDDTGGADRITTVTVINTVTAPADAASAPQPAVVRFTAASAIASTAPAGWASLNRSQQTAVVTRWIDIEGLALAPGAVLKTLDDMAEPRPAETMRSYLTRATARTEARIGRVRVARARAKAARAKAARVAAARAKAERRRQAAAAARARAAAAAEQARRQAAASCDPNYSGACVPPYPPDLNCPDIGTSVQVVGSDPHGLDGDRDGWGCESY